MNYRPFGRTGWQVSEIGIGTWQFGADWGKVTDADAQDAMRTAIKGGINFFDTADVYGDGRSEQIVGKVVKEFSERIYVATKMGRGLKPHVPEGFTRENMNRFIERSLVNLGVETVDLVQLHCPPNQVYYMPEVFGILDDIVKSGKLRFYGVSVEKVEEAVKAMEFPNLQSVQIIFNIFRQRPAELFFPLAKRKRVGILARVPLASGLLSGKITRQTHFDPYDHRSFNRHGEHFDVGETFSGVDFETGLAAVEELRALVPAGVSMAQFALRWILMFEEVSLAIPGAKNSKQAADNLEAADLPAIDEKTMDAIRKIYDRSIRAQVHQRW